MPADCFIHPDAVLETTDIGRGTRIWGWTHVQGRVSIGRDCNVGEHCFIENGVRIGDRVVVKNGISLWTGTVVEDDAFLGPHVVIANERFPRSGYRKEWQGVRIRRGASVGAGAVILPGVSVGEFAVVGAGAVVTRDVANHTLVFGNPARERGWMCRCGLKLTFSDGRAACSCGRGYRLGLDRRVLLDAGLR